MKTTAQLKRYTQHRCNRCRRPATCELYTGRPDGFFQNGFRGLYCDEHGREELAVERDLQRGGLGGFTSARVGCTGKPSIGVLTAPGRGRTLWTCQHKTHKRVEQAFNCARDERDRRGWKRVRGDYEPKWRAWKDGPAT